MSEVQDAANNVVRDDQGRYLGNVFEAGGAWFYVAVVGWRKDGSAVTIQSGDDYETACDAVDALKEFVEMNGVPEVPQ